MNPQPPPKDFTDDVLDAALDRGLLEAAAPVTPPADLRARVLGRVHATAATTGVMSRASAGMWKPVSPGIEVKTLFYDEAQRMVSFLLRAQPGAQLPAHHHHAYEECLVLQGEFTLGDVTLRAGDFELGRPGEAHPAATTHTGVLVYLRGAGEDYPFACP